MGKKIIKRNLNEKKTKKNIKKLIKLLTLPKI